MRVVVVEEKEIAAGKPQGEYADVNFNNVYVLFSFYSFYHTDTHMFEDVLREQREKRKI